MGKVAKVKAVEKTTKLSVVGETLEGILELTKASYLEMHKSWFGFAKNLYYLKCALKDAPIKKDFKDILNEHFPDVDYKYASQMCVLVERYGAEIQQRLEKTSSQIPAMRSLLLLASADDGNQDKTAITKLKKDLFDNNLTIQALKDRIAELERKTSIKDLEKENEEKAVVEDAAKDIVDVEDEEEESDEDVIEEDLWGAVSAIHTRIKTLNDNIPTLMDLIMAHGKKDSRLTNLFNDCVDLYNEGLTNLMDAIDKLGGKK